jgi:hypothetical protein
MSCKRTKPLRPCREARTESVERRSYRSPMDARYEGLREAVFRERCKNHNIVVIRQHEGTIARIMTGVCQVELRRARLRDLLRLRSDE